MRSSPVGALVSPGLNSLPSWNTVRLEPCCAFRREATCAPARHALVSKRSRGRCHARPLDALATELARGRRARRTGQTRVPPPGGQASQSA
jgi:hypothetical protein